MKRIIVSFIILCTVLSFINISYAENFDTSTPTLNNWEPIAFNDSNTYPGKKVTVNTMRQLEWWHYEDGYWKVGYMNVNPIINVQDSQVNDFVHEVLQSSQFSQPLTSTITLPQEVTDFIKKNGEDKIKLKFNTGNFNFSDIFQDYSLYKINSDGTMNVQFTPVFNISRVPIFDSPDMNVTIPQSKTSFGYVAYSIADKSTGNYLGTSYDKFISPSDIADSNGNLNSGKTYYYYKDSDSNQSNPIPFTADQGSIGLHTFMNGGAVGVGFYFPINVDIYMDDTPTVTPRPAPDETTAKGKIIFDPDSCPWRNTDLSVREYVDGEYIDGDKTIRVNERQNRIYYYYSEENGKKVLHTGSTSCGMYQNWIVSNIYTWGTPIPAANTILDNGTVTVSVEGIGNLNAKVNSWSPKNKGWYNEAPPKGWWSSTPPANSKPPQVDYLSKSGLYKIDKTKPVITFDWFNQDGLTPDGKHNFIYLPDNYVRAKLSDNLSGISESKYKWSTDATFPDLSTMNNLGVITPEGSTQEVIKDIPVHDTQDRIKAWYLHVYAKDRAGNETQTTQPVFIEVSLQNFRITDITDRQWESVFYNSNHTPKGVYYPVKLMPVDRSPNNAYVKKGYAFNFEMNSRGLNLDTDIITLKPRFFYLKDLSTASINSAYEVDLYYDMGNQYLIKYGDPVRDKYSMTYQMPGGKYSISSNMLNLTLNKNVRTIIDPKNSKWYGRYALLSTTKAVKKGTPIVKNGSVDYSVFLKRGFILVNFTPEAYKRGTLKAFEYNPTQWTAEGGPKASAWATGDTIVYDLEHSDLDDYGTGTDR